MPVPAQLPETKASGKEQSGEPALAIYYEHPRWFQPLFDELARRNVPFHKLHADTHFFEPGEPVRIPVLFNRMSPSAYRRGSGSDILYTLNYLEHLESNGVRVINGTRAYRYEISKAAQLTLLAQLNLPFPRARVIHRHEDAPVAALGLRFPVVIKPNIGGSGAGIIRFDSPEALEDAARSGSFELGLDGIGLVQEFIPARGGHITRVEVLDGKFLYAIKVYLSGQTFDLCPADLCRTTPAVAVENACPVEAPKTGLTVEGYTPPLAVIEAVERITREAGIEVGGVEYTIDDRDGQLYYYDINALSNFVAEAQQVVGFDPFPRLADFLEQEIDRAER